MTVSTRNAGTGNQSLSCTCSAGPGTKHLSAPALPWIFFLPTSRNVLPTFQTFYPNGVRFDQTVVHFAHFPVQARKRGVLGWGWGCFVYVHIFERVLWRLSKEQGLGVVIWAKWDPPGQFILKVVKCALELGKKIQSSFCRTSQWSPARYRAGSSSLARNGGVWWTDLRLSPQRRATSGAGCCSRGQSSIPTLCNSSNTSNLLALLRNVG